MERRSATALSSIHHVLAESVPGRNPVGHQRADFDADSQAFRSDPHRMAGQGTERSSTEGLRVCDFRVGEAGEGFVASLQHSRHFPGLVERRIDRVNPKLVLVVDIRKHERQLLLQDLIETYQGEGGRSDSVDHRGLELHQEHEPEIGLHKDSLRWRPSWQADSRSLGEDHERFV